MVVLVLMLCGGVSIDAVHSINTNTATCGGVSINAIWWC